VAPPKDGQSLFEHANEPMKLVVLPGIGHHEVHAGPAFDAVMRDAPGFGILWNFLRSPDAPAVHPALEHR
jgi:hypothetical protein